MSTTKFDSLDFDKIKNNIKSHLSSKTEFNDHNFEGSTWSLILDACAFAAHYTGVYSNLALSETFLDSAQLRNSVVSRAKEIGHIPKQMSAAKASVKLTLTTNPGQTIVIPANTTFSATVDSVGFTFATTLEYNMVEISSGEYEVVVDIIQGTAGNIQYTTVLSTTDEYVVYDKSVDTNSVRVTVNGEEFTQETSYVLMDNSSKAFFVGETLNQQLEITFGDGILGVSPSPGDDIQISWLSTEGDLANGISKFKLMSVIDNIDQSLWVTSTINMASGGAQKDSIEKIKFLAPKVYQAQNRLVTKSDYNALLLNKFANIKSVSVWGGEENIPPVFGSVFVSVVNAGTNSEIFGAMSPQDKLDIQDFLNTYKILSITPKLVSPEFIYLDVDASVTYDRKLTTSSALDLSLLVKAAIGVYFTNNLQVFSGKLRLSKLLSAIDNVSTSILDSLISLNLIKYYEVPAANIPNILNLNYSDIELTPGTFISNVFNTDDQYTDNGLGDIMLHGLVVGKINYDLATIIINNVNFAPSSTIEFKVKPANYNISSKHLNIIDKGTITATMLES